MKKAFIIGHYLLSQGAFSEDLQESEYYFNSKVAQFLKKMGNDIFYHDHKITSYRQRCKAMAEKIKNYDIAFELHYNFFNLTSANGVEAVYWNGNKKGEVLANLYIDRVADEFGVRKREPLKAYEDGVEKIQHRGYWMLYYPKPTTLLLEPFFGSNKKDCHLFKGKHEDYAVLLNEL